MENKDCEHPVKWINKGQVTCRVCGVKWMIDQHHYNHLIQHEQSNLSKAIVIVLVLISMYISFMVIFG